MPTSLNIQNFAYQMANIQTRAGTTVTWKNQDNVLHSVTFKNSMKDKDTALSQIIRMVQDAQGSKAPARWG